MKRATLLPNGTQVGVAAFAVLVLLSLSISAVTVTSTTSGSGAAANPIVFLDTGDPKSSSSSKDGGKGIVPKWDIKADEFSVRDIVSTFGNGIGSGSEAVVTRSISNFGLLLLIPVLCIVGVCLIKLRSTDEFDRQERSADTADTVGEATNSSSARRATTSSSVNLDNGVYRAWYEMIQNVDIPDSNARTPTEYAIAAVECGFETDAVTDITVRFEQIRYGRTEVTPDHEERAQAALDRIKGSDGEGST